MEPSPAALAFLWRVLGSPAVPSGSSHLSWPASLPLSTKSPSWSECQTAPAPHSHSSWRVPSRDVSPWHLCCPARRGAGNAGSVREPGPLAGTGGFQQALSSSCSSELQLAAEGRRASSEVFWIAQAPLPVAQLPAPSHRASVEQGWDQWMLPQGVSLQAGLTLSLALLDFFPNSSVPFLRDSEGICPTLSECHMSVGRVNQSCLCYLTQTLLACAGKEILYQCGR